jgi:hypothetical protein
MLNKLNAGGRKSIVYIVDTQPEQLDNRGDGGVAEDLAPRIPTPLLLVSTIDVFRPESANKVVTRGRKWR